MFLRSGLGLLLLASFGASVTSSDALNQVLQDLNLPAVTTVESSSTQQAPTTVTASRRPPKDCYELYQQGSQQAGIYDISLSHGRIVKTWCEDGWTTVQRRAAGKESFDRTFKEYADGFGSVDADHWWGLDNLVALTSSQSCVLKVDLKLDDGAGANKRIYKNYRKDGDGGLKHVQAEHFAVGYAEDYRLTAENISTNLQAVNWAQKLQSEHSGRNFSAKDKDRDEYSGWNCATDHSLQSGWWYSDCGSVYVNGKSKSHYCSASNKVCARLGLYQLQHVEMRVKC